MMLALVAVLVVGIALMAAMYAAEAGLWPRDERRQTVELRLPRELAAAAVVDVLRGLSGLPRRGMVVLSIAADEHGVRHFLSAPPAVLASVRSALRAVAPAVRLLPTEAHRSDTYQRGVSWRLSPRQGALRDQDAERVAAALLAAMQPLAAGERVLIRWVLGPGQAPPLPAPLRGREQRRWPFALGEDAPPERLRMLRAKYRERLLRGRLVVAAGAEHPERARHLLARVSSVLRSVAGPHGRLVGRRLGGKRLVRLLASPRLGLRPDLLSATELAGLIGWPVGGVTLPGLNLGAAPLRLPFGSIPTRGRRLARSNWPGLRRELCLSPAGALSHVLAAGPTGSGKSALLLRGIVDELAAGHGLLVLDGRGDLAEDVLARIPPRRQDEVIVLDPGAGGPLPGLSLLGRGGDPELLADVVLGVFADLFADSWGPRSALFLHLGLVTLAHDPTATLADFPRLFGDDAYRRALVGRLADPLLVGTWAGFEAMGAPERAHVLAAPLNKIMSLVGRRSLRAILAQADPAIDLASVMARGQVLIVNLATGVIGAPAARLLGALVVHALYVATQARARVPVSRRRPFFGFIDEPQVLSHLPVPLDTLLQQARGLGVGLSIGVQSVEQLSREVRQAVLTNAATIAAFRQNADDARLLARELDGVAPEELQALAQFEVVARLGLGDGAVSPPATGVTFPPPEPTSEPAELRRRSAGRYGVDPAAVDAALFARQQRIADDAPIGRLRRER
jgi:hypothetical protein